MSNEVKLRVTQPNVHTMPKHKAKERGSMNLQNLLNGMHGNVNSYVLPKS
jgi:hypothetical protein